MIRLLSLVFCVSNAAAQMVSARAEHLYQDSLFQYTKGEYKKALEGFMDVLLEDPAYPGARDRLTATALRLRAQEEQRVERERRQLMSDIERAKTAAEGAAQALMPAMSDAPDFMEDWERSIKEALSSARDSRGLSETLRAYEKALKSFPIRHDNGHELIDARAKLQERLAKTFPLDPDPAWKNAKPGRFNTGDFASAVFARKHHSERWKNSSQGLFIFAQKDRTDSGEDLAASVGEAEKLLGRQSKLAFDAYQRFSADKFRESAALWRELLALDPGNREAEFFIEKASRRLSAPAPPAAAPAPKTVKTPPAAKPEVKPAPEPPEEEQPKEGKEALAQEYYLKGLRDYSTGKLDDAILHWKACLELDPAHQKGKKALDRALLEKAP